MFAKFVAWIETKYTLLIIEHDTSHSQSIKYSGTGCQRPG